MGPGVGKLPLNMYITRQHKADLKRAAHRRGISMTSIVLELLDQHSAKVAKLYGKPKPVPVYKAPWIKRRDAARIAKAKG